jgi:hypothetical protein
VVHVLVHLQRLVQLVAQRLPRDIGIPALAIEAFVVAAYGVALVLRGLRNGRQFSRILGSALVVAPALRAALVQPSIRLEEFGWMLLFVGMGFAAIGFAIKSQSIGEPERADASSVEASSQ